MSSLIAFLSETVTMTRVEWLITFWLTYLLTKAVFWAFDKLPSTWWSVMNRDDTKYPIPPMQLPNGTSAQLRCMEAVDNGLKRLSRRDLERLVRGVADEVNARD